jgi:hypothetical protein
MSPSKLYMSLSTDAEDASPPDGTVAKDSPAIPPFGVAPTAGKFGFHAGHPASEEDIPRVAAGRLPEEVYANTLPWWRAALRRKCVEVVEWESEILGRWQVRFLLDRPPASGERASSCTAFAGARPVALARHVLFADFDAWDAYVLSRVPSRDLLLWVPRAGKRVSAALGFLSALLELN